MSEVAPSFDEVFLAVHGRDPFPWQATFAGRLLEEGWPRFIDVPTGLGKTSVIDVALYALACDALRPPPERTARMRIAFVVDRRLIVDAAHHHVERIRAVLASSTEGPARWLRDRLCSISGSDEAVISRRMRGGLTWTSLWSESPCQPLVLTATVDQFGSRFLFRGYGTSDWVKPVDAGLLGTDTVVLLDEAHMSRPLVETIEGCGVIESMSAEVPLERRRTVVVQMTATPAERAESLITETDLEHEAASARLTARKRAHLLDATFAMSPTKASTDAGTTLARAATRLMDGQASVTAPRTALVVANTVAAARVAFDELRRSGVDSALVVGRARPIDREAKEGSWLPRTKTERRRLGDEPPFVLVATQTVEVGVDIDVDAIVTELAPIDALVQRFGRVDRRGDLGDTTSFIVRVPSRLRDDPPPYGPAAAATWRWLERMAPASIVDARGRSDGIDDHVDMGTLAIRTRLDDTEDIGALIAPVTRPPIVLAPTVSTWRRTSPIPAPDESVTNYLHGVGHGQPTVSIVWRCDLDDLDDGEGVGVPLGVHEVVEVSVSAARRLLRGEAPLDTSDLVGESDPDPVSSVSAALHPSFVRRGDSWSRIEPSVSIRAGDVIVVSSSVGGHDEWSFTGVAGEPTIDVAELDGRNVFLRLDRRVLTQLVGRELSDTESQLLKDATSVVSDDEDGIDRVATASDLCRTLRQDLASSRYESSVALLLDEFTQVTALTVERDRVAKPGRPNGRWIARRRDLMPAGVSDDRDMSSESRQQVALADHLGAVQQRAAEFVQACGLEEPLARAVCLAARLHDLGKADPRFQAMLAGAPRWFGESLGTDAHHLFAKSAPSESARRRSIDRASGWPVGYRHEAISLALVANAPAEWFGDVDRELVEHLVAAHHGRARPLFPSVDGSEDVNVRVDFDGRTFAASTRSSHPAWAQPARFDRLCERYGTWGLAYLEALVRLADISISKEGR